MVAQSGNGGIVMRGKAGVGFMQQKLCLDMMMCIPFARPAGRLLRKPSHRTSASLAMLSLTCMSSLIQAAPTVEGQTIVLPDDGWYQVQSRPDYREICAAVSSCEVPVGRYIVINHTTGERFEDVQVGLDPVGQEQLVISANGISFFIEGLAVDQAYEFEIRPFDLSEGVAISVPASTQAHGPAENRDLNLSNATQVLAGIVSVINEEAIDVLYDTAAQDLNFQDKFFEVSNARDDIVLSQSGEPQTPYPVEIDYGQGRYHDATHYSTYTCAAGGSLTVYDASQVYASDTVFDACVAGSNTYSGTTGYRDALRAAVYHYPVYDFTVTDSNGDTRVLTGGYESANLSIVISDIETGWESAYYRGPVEGGKLQINDYSVLRKRVDTQFTHGPTVRPGDDGNMISVQDYRLENSVTGDFAVQAP